MEATDDDTTGAANAEGSPTVKLVLSVIASRQTCTPRALREDIHHAERDEYVDRRRRR
jgi:hypothetical protein